MPKFNTGPKAGRGTYMIVGAFLVVFLILIFLGLIHPSH